MSYLPTEILKRIFWFQEEWWLNNKRKLINIQKLSQIPPIMLYDSTLYYKLFMLQLTISDIKKYILGYKEITVNDTLSTFSVRLYHKRNNNMTLSFSYDHADWIKVPLPGPISVPITN